jgi:hypothetical protein
LFYPQEKLEGGDLGFSLERRRIEQEQAKTLTLGLGSYLGFVEWIRRAWTPEGLLPHTSSFG